MEDQKMSAVASLPLVHITAPPSSPMPEGQKPPVLVLLHGVGSNEYDLLDLKNYLDPRLFVVSVRSPLTIGPQAYGWYPVHFTEAGAVGDTAAAEKGRQTLVQFLEALPSVYDIDPKRLYLMGFSQGSVMSLFTLLTRPDLVTGAVIMSGRLLPEAWDARADDNALRHLHVLAVHGTQDRVLPIADGRNIRERLSSLPIDFDYKEYPMGHAVSSESVADITSWLTSKLG